jgi:hypothetical protein
VRRDPEGRVLLDTRHSGSQPSVGSAVWGDALPPHTLENVGPGDLHNITVELKGDG